MISAAPSPAQATAAGLGAALCWTLASLLWRRLPTALSALQLNLLKTLLAGTLQLPLVLLQPWSAPPWRLGLLAASGVLGIALGDSFYFAALRRLGTRRCLTLEAGGPAVTALAGVALLEEVPRPDQWLGILLISAAVLLVARQRPPGLPARPAPQAGPAGVARPAPAGEIVPATATATATAAADSGPQGHGLQAAITPGADPAGAMSADGDRLGLLLGLAGLLCGSAGALLSRAALVGGALTPLQAATLRLAAASLVLLPLLRGLPAAAHWPRRARGRWPLVLLATLLGTSGGLVLQQTALAGLPGGLAVSLLATAPLIGVLLAPLEGDRPGWLGLLAACCGLLGVSLVVGVAPGWLG
ncbi:MAG: DMT family transporter [Synechococcaceae cyanobacterium]|nr:DMT family transporter [Synechococcaceae cyanobacterium]